MTSREELWSKEDRWEADEYRRSTPQQKLDLFRRRLNTYPPEHQQTAVIKTKIQELEKYVQNGEFLFLTESR